MLYKEFSSLWLFDFIFKNLYLALISSDLKLLEFFSTYTMF